MFVDESGVGALIMGTKIVSYLCHDSGFKKIQAFRATI